MWSKEHAQNSVGLKKLEIFFFGGGVGENTHELEKNANMLDKINTIITPCSCCLTLAQSVSVHAVCLSPSCAL